MQVGEIKTRIMQRTDDAGAIAATGAELLAAINEGCELASLLTLYAETSTALTLTSAGWGTWLTALPYFLCPLRLTVGGARIRPATLAELDSENESWQMTTGTPNRYVTVGANLYCVTPQPAGNTAATLIYARSPQPLTADGDSPTLPEEYHLSLVHYGKYRVRVKEGAQGLARALTDLNAFLDDMTRLGDFVRARSRAARYDTLPFELALFDRSRLAEAKEKKRK